MASTMADKTRLDPQVCVSLHQNLDYRGIFTSGNPFNYVIPVFMLQIIFSGLLSRAIYVILRPLKQPKLVCNILAGIILGPTVLGRSKSYREKMFAPKETMVLATATNLAAFLFVFLICIKMKASMASKIAKQTWRIGLACMAFPFLFTLILIGSLRNFLPGIAEHGAFPIQFSIASSLSYFIVIADALDELNLLSSELGQLATSIATLNEIVSFFIVMIGIAASQKNSWYSLLAILFLCGLILFAIYVIRPALRWVIKRTPKGKPVEEGYVIAIIVSTMLLGVLTDALGVTLFPAAMIMGYIIPDGPPLGETLMKKSELVLSEIFLPLFFLRIGYFTDLSTLQDWKEFAIFGVVILGSYLGRLVGSYLFSSTVGIGKTNAIFFSLILSLQGMVELLQGIRWKHQKLLSDQNFSSLVLSIVILNGIMTPIIEIFYNPEADESADLLESFKFRSRSLGMTSILGELRVISCVQDEDNVSTILNLLEALKPMEVSPICAYVIHLVPLATQTVPLLVPYKNHKRRFNKRNGSDSIMRAFLNYSRNAKGPVQIQPFRMVAPFKYMHGPICRLAEAMRAPLIIVPFFKRQEVHNTDGTVRIFNTNILACAKCTVGILVDRGLRTHFSLTSFTYNVAVVFLGGPDDREALILAGRMSHHPNVAITVLRISLRGNSAKGIEQEKELDDFMFREFKAMNVGNACVVCHELEAYSSEGVMKALRSMPDSYDLVVVGKRQGCNSEFEESLIDWTEYQELGVLGDAIAQPDFCGGMMSVLVLQNIGVGDGTGSSRSNFFLP